MEQADTFRYRVAMKKAQRIFTMTVSGLMISLSSIVLVLTAVFSLSEQAMDVSTFFVSVLSPLLFILFGVIGVISAAKRVDVYGGEVVYYLGWKRKTYCLADIKTAKTQTEAYQTGLHYEDIVPVESYDTVTAFYDQAGKRLFRFGSGYSNVDRLKADVEHTQKRISKQKRAK